MLFLSYYFFFKIIIIVDPFALFNFDFDFLFDNVLCSVLVRLVLSFFALFFALPADVDDDDNVGYYCNFYFYICTGTFAHFFFCLSNVKS